MRIAALILGALLLFCACAPGGPQEDAVEAVLPEPAPEGPEEPEETFTATVYRPDPDRSLEETVAQYFEQQYNAYIALAHIDISALLDMSQQGNRNLLTWLETLAMRRRLLWQNELCYVERERFDYEIVYFDAAELEDDRMVHWDNGWIGAEETVVHFEITGEPGRAYPPTLAPNSQHTMRLIREEDGWKIIFHYFPGSVRKFYLNDELQVPEEDAMLAELLEEFAPVGQPEPEDPPEDAAAYDGALAAAYAILHAEDANPDFYHAGDWIGNCSNFTSQCVWYGFGGGETPDLDSYQYMTYDWYAGNGGGSPAWENVEYFWACITGSDDLVGVVLEGAGALTEGDLIQTKAGVALPQEEEEEGDRFNHMMIVVDAQSLLLAQNSPSSFVYYSDLVEVETRFVRPVYVIE